MRRRRDEAVRWELSPEERRAILASGRTLTTRAVARALLRRPGALLDALRSLAEGAANGLRNDPGLLWLAQSEGVRSVVPDAAEGILWSDTRVFLEALEPYLGESAAVAEVGCGAGRVARLVAPQVGELVASDASRAMLAVARERLAGLANVRLVRTDRRTLEPLEADRFDVVYSHDVFRQLDPIPALGLIDEMFRILRPGGVAVVSCDTIDPPDWARSEVAKLRAAVRRGHLGPTYARPYVARQIDAWLEVVGFEVVDRRRDESNAPYYVVAGRKPPPSPAATAPGGPGEPSPVARR